MELTLLQWLNWPLKVVYVVGVRPLARLLTGNPTWPGPEPETTDAP